ncbi:MAG: 5-deoxy-glucuronate isomerase [Chloroflexota bacterium]
MNEHLVHPNKDKSVMIEVTPESVGWEYLSFRVIALKSGESYQEASGGNEVALVPQAGSATVTVGDQTFDISRQGVFIDKPQVLYVPPGHTISVEATADFEFATGGAPAEGKYPLRLFTPDEIRSEVRGGGAATRQVNHILSHPLPAERLILFEVYVPGGGWSGWPPHCHDGYGGSAHLDETYYFRCEPDYGYTFHRNYRLDTDFDETFVAQDRDLVLVTQGFHSTAPAPNANLYFLNYLAGELIDDDRATPPYDDPSMAWVKDDNWEKNVSDLPIIK